MLSVLLTIHQFQFQRSCSIYFHRLHSNKLIGIAIILILTLTFWYDLNFTVPYFSFASILKELFKIFLMKIDTRYVLRVILECVIVHFNLDPLYDLDSTNPISYLQFIKRSCVHRWQQCYTSFWFLIFTFPTVWILLLILFVIFIKLSFKETFQDAHLKKKLYKM